jgi:hypothetical protein
VYSLTDDFVGVTAIKLKCCEVDDPAKYCIEHFEWRPISKTCEEGTHCAFALQVGILYSQTLDPKYKDGYEGSGYNIFDAWPTMEAFVRKTYNSTGLSQEVPLKLHYTFTRGCSGRVHQLVLYCELPQPLGKFYEFSTPEFNCIV